MAKNGMLYLSVCLVLLFAARTLSATDNARPKASLGGLNHEYSSPELIAVVDSSYNFIADSLSTLAPFIDKLSRIRQGSVETASIIHLGDSHIQAGFITDVIRSSFQRDFGDAGRGLVAPLRLMNSNEPRGYRIVSSNRWVGATCINTKDGGCRIGISGMGITSGDSRVEFTISSDSPFSTVRAFHHPFAPLLIEPRELSTGVCCPEDSMSFMTSIFLNDTVRAVTLSAPITDERYNYQTYHGFSLETGGPGVLHHSVGINGAAFAHYNNNVEMLTHQRALSPDLIVVSLGTNDSYGNGYKGEDVRRSIERFLELCGALFPSVPLLLTTPMESCSRRTVNRRRTYVPNANLACTADLIVRLALERGIAFWDLYMAAGGEGANKRWYDRGLVASDRLHLTREGYGLQGEMFYEAFTRYYNAQKTGCDGEL